MPSNIFTDFLPAEVRITKKEIYVSYHVLNPATELMERKRVRCNHVHPKTEAVKFARLLCRQINEKLYQGWNPFKEVSKAGSSTTIEKAVSDFMAAKKRELRPDSLRSYESFCKKFIKFVGKRKSMLLSTFTEQDAERLMFRIDTESSPTAKTYNNYIIFFRTMFNSFIKKHLIKENPFQSIDSRRTDKKRRQTIPKETRRMIMQYFTDNGLTEFNYIMLLCFKMFIRPKEILLLKVSDIDFKEGLLRIRSEISKTHEEDYMAVPSDIMQYFETLQDENQNNFIFSTGYKCGSKQINSRDTARTWAEMRKKLALPIEYQLYSLKDTGITEMLESGVPSKIVRDLARHASIQTTEMYVHRANAKRILENTHIDF